MSKESIVLPFDHQHSAHCESGVMSTLLRREGLDISEAMAIGLSSAITFAYIPVVKMGGLPLFAYRMPPGAVIKGLEKRLGVRMKKERFQSPEAGMEALDRHLKEGRPVGLQASAFFLTFFPPDMRFHFNAHNLIAFGKEGEEYLISDPVFEHTVRIHSADLQKARFAKGVMAPKGLLYYPVYVPDSVDLKEPIRKAIKKSINIMTRSPVPWIGVKGIRHLGKVIRKLPVKKPGDTRYHRLFIGQIVRMQEEIGTGGGGFRFLYAMFLKQSADILGKEILVEASEKMSQAGDEWRIFATTAARMFKEREQLDYEALGESLDRVAEKEQAAFDVLKKL